MTIRNTFGTVLVTAALMSGSTAAASTVTLEKQNETSVFLDENGENSWLVQTDYTVGSATIPNAAIGAYHIKADLMGGIANFLAFCLEPLQSFELPSEYQQVNRFGADVTMHLNMLAENALGEVNSHATAAAFQMAAWEITTESALSFGLDDGEFSVAGGSNNANAAKDLAGVWLNNIETNVWSAPTSSFLILSSDTEQDLLTSIQIAAVPVPASGLMLASVLIGAGGLTARRRRAAQRT